VSRQWSRTKIWVASIAAILGLLPAVIVGLLGYLRATAPLHTNAADVPTVAQSSPSPERAAAAELARQIVRAALVEQNLPGLSAAVGVGGDVVWAEGVGWADLESRQPVAPGTRFRIGSASVALTSAAVGMLLEKDRLDLDEEIQSYVPAFPKKPWPVTLRQVMAHLSGVRNDGGDEGPLLSARCLRPVDALEQFADRPLLFEPGTRYHYSSYGWILVSAAVEAAANEPFLTFMQTRVFEPLGMHDTRADSATEPIANRVTPYFPRFGADPLYGLHLMRPIDYSCYAGSSAFLSTPSDLVRFGMAIESGKVLQPATVDVLQTSQRLNSGEETGYGLGWDVDTVTLAGKQTPLAGHDGTSLGGTVASLIILRERGIVVAVTSNISYADTRAVALKIAEAFADNRGR
jgi:serine beta-lactamase-like protein LACTB